MHGAARVHSQTVGHARPGAAIAGTGCPTVVGGARVITWKKMAHMNELPIIEILSIAQIMSLKR